jgi:hypothetical protein
MIRTSVVPAATRRDDMSKLKTLPPDAEDQRRTEEARELATRIGRNIISVLGRPAEFARIVVAPLWDRTHRVNVLTGEDPTSIRIAHIFFVVVDDDGKVLESSPPLARRY